MILFFLLSCETRDQRIIRIQQHIQKIKKKAVQDSLDLVRTNKLRLKEDKRRKELEEKERLRKLRIKKEEEEQIAAERAKEAALLLEQKEREKWASNFLNTGSMPWSDCYGSNNRCSYGCSKISIYTPSSSDVLVTLKKDNQVVRHVYIRKRSSYTLEVPNGTYQPFFYYGNGWNPNKNKNSSSCGSLKGSFTSGESISKDNPTRLNNNVLTYELIMQQNGNLQTKASNASEAF